MSYDISSIGSEPPECHVSFTLNNVSWREVVDIIGGICPELSDRDLDYMADYKGWGFFGIKAAHIQSELNNLISNKKDIVEVKIRSGERIKMESYKWANLEQLHSLVSCSEGFAVS